MTQAKAHMRDIIDATLAEFPHLDRLMILSPRRDRATARPRMVAMALSVELGRRSLPQVGMYYGGRDHTTVMHAMRFVAALCQTDAAFAASVATIKDRIAALMSGDGGYGYRERLRQSVLADPQLRASAEKAAQLGEQP